MSWDETQERHLKAQFTFKTPKTSRVALVSAFMLDRDRFLLGLTTTSPQCFGTVPPEVGRLVCDLSSGTTGV